MPDNTVLVKRFFDEVCNARKLDAADALFASGHTYRDPSSPWVGPGPQGMKDLVSTYQRAFPDAHWAVDQTYVAGDVVVTRWTGSGTHKGTLAGIAPTGKKVAVQGIWIHRVVGGKISESWNVWDTLGMLQQLGVVQPLPAQAV